MKKILSLMLSLALIISTLALPIAVSADTPGTAGAGKINVTYELSKETVNPGDTFDVIVKARASGLDEETTSINIDEYNLDIAYDAAQFEFLSATNEAQDRVDNSDTTKHYVNAAKTESSSISFESAAEITKITFKVKDAAVAGSYSTSIIADDSFFMSTSGKKVVYYDKTTGNLTDAANAVKIVANKYEVKVDGESVVNGKTFYGKTGDATLTITGTHFETLTLDGTSLTTETEGSYSKTLSEAKEYTLVVKVKGGQEETIKFTISKNTVAAKIGVSVPAATVGYYKAGDAITVPVSLSGLAEDQKAAMVTFKVEYDSANLDLSAESADLGGLSYDTETQTFKYGTESAEEGKGNEQIGTLKFTVKENAAYGLQTIKLTESNLALVRQAVNPGKDKIAFEPGNNTFIIADTELATIDNSTLASNWTKTAYNVTVTPKTGVTVKYLEYDPTTTTISTDAQEGLKGIFKNNAAVELENNKMNIKSSKNYVAVACVGDSNGEAYYQLVGEVLTSEKTKFDDVKPTVTIKDGFTIDGVQSSVGDGYELILKDNITFADTLSGVAEIYYMLGETTSESANWIKIDSVYAESAKISANANYKGKISFKAIDSAGNEGTAATVFEVQLDGDAPTVTNMKAGVAQTETTESGESIYKNITATVADIGSSVKAVKAYCEASTSEMAKADVASIEALGNGTEVAVADGTATYKVSAPGRYYFVAEDQAGNKGFGYTEVTFATLTKADDIKVKIYADQAEGKLGFYPTNDAKATTYGESNGKYLYFSAEVVATDGNTTTMTIQKDTDEAAAAYTGAAIVGSEDTVGDYTLTVTTTNADKASVSATYKFSIAKDQDSMVSPSGDKRYNIFDYTMIRLALEEESKLPAPETGFSALYAGDLNGDFAYTAEDLSLLINSIRAGEKPGYYSFKIMNGTQKANANASASKGE